MAKRSYGQLSPLARALDILGERWALLVVQELSFGPKRYTDILDGLPGIGPQILVARLRELQEAGLVEKGVLPPPAASTVYQLTERGRRLEGPLAGLARFGLEFVDGGAGDPLRLGGFLAAFAAPEPRRIPARLDACIEFRVEEERFQLRVKDGRVQVSEGQEREPHAVVTSGRSGWLALMAGSGAKASAPRGVRIEGDRDRAAQVLALLRERAGE